MLEPDERQIAAQDANRYRRVLCSVLALTLTAFALGSAAQSTALALGGVHIPVWHRIVANLVSVLIICLGTWASPVARLTPRRRASVLVGLSFLGILGRTFVAKAFGIHGHGLYIPLPIPADTSPLLISSWIAVAISLAVANYQHRLTVQARARAEQAVLAAAALNALRAEEIRVRRQVAEGLHGTLQQQLVVLSTHLRRTADSLRPDDPREAAIAKDLTWVQDELDRLRERDVRDMSRMLYPSGLDLGLAQASRLLLQRIPPSIEVVTSIDESVIAAEDRSADGIPLDLRLLATRVLEEAVANALRHGNAARLDVHLKVDATDVLHIVVDDDGSGHAPDTVESGLGLLRERLGERGGDLALTSGRLGGTRLTAQLPLALG